jgi:hypothetical protein
MDGIANPGGGDGVAPTARGQPSGSANTSQQQIEDRDRIAADLNEVVVRRLYSAGLFLQSALALLDGHRAQ